MVKNDAGYEYNTHAFFIGSNDILYRSDLKDKSKLLYLHITNRYNFFLYANQYKVHGKLTELDRVYCETQETMALAIGYSASSKAKVNPLIKELESKGLLKIQSKLDGRNSNWYIPLTAEGVPNITIPDVNESVMQGFSSKSIKREPKPPKQTPTKQPQKPVETIKEESNTDVPDWMRDSSINDTDTFNPFGYNLDDLADPF